MSSAEEEATWKEVQHKVVLDRAKWCAYVSATQNDAQKRYEKKVFHIESQRTTGNMVVDRFMAKTAKFFHCKDPGQVESVFEMFKKSVMSDCKTGRADTYTVVLIDFTKLGVLTLEALDWTTSLAAKVLENDATGVAVVLAPILENPTVEGERMRIEKKLRAKNFDPRLITLIACLCAPKRAGRGRVNMASVLEKG